MVEELTLSGYQPYTEVLAQRATQTEGRSIYIVALPIHLISNYLPIPDPEVSFPGNRRVSKSHAEGFGKYWRRNLDWVAPPLLIDTTAPLDERFESRFKAGGVEFGVLRLYQNSASEFDILDGQHRILGWKLAGETIADDLKKARKRLAGLAETDPERARLMAEIEELRRLEARFSSEYVTLQILHGLSLEAHKQAFSDIANNARGITRSITANFDHRYLFNRIAAELGQNHPLLGERIDWEKDRLLGKNENLLSGKNLVDVIHHVNLGIGGRMTERRESEMSESAALEVVQRFLDALLMGFEPLRRLQADEVSVSELREEEMLVSATVLRVLAGAFHDLAVDNGDDTAPRIDKAGFKLAVDLFQALDGRMKFPLETGWYETGYFDEGAKAPSSRAQDLRGLTDLLVHWAKKGEVFSKPGL